MPQVPTARPADVASMDAILDALYDVISGPKEQERDWDRLRSLFAPGARIIPTHTDNNGVAQADVMSVPDFINMAGPVLEKEGFFERESHRTVERYGAIAHVFSTYDRATPQRMPSRSSAASTASSFCSMAIAGGW